MNYKLRDWLFSRQHFWGEPFPILRELDDHGQPNGLIRALKPQDLPLDLPEKMQFDAAHDRPEPPLDKRSNHGSTSRWTTSVTAAKPTPCRNGPAPVGITSASSIRRTTTA